MIADVSDLALFSVPINEVTNQLINQYWPGPVSIIIGGQAFRLPADEKLRDLLRQTGPLVAPSANPEGLPPATTIEEAKKYFSAEGGSASGGGVDWYEDGGTIVGKPSKLIEIKDGTVRVLRP